MGLYRAVYPLQLSRVYLPCCGLCKPVQTVLYGLQRHTAWALLTKADPVHRLQLCPHPAGKVRVSRHAADYVHRL